jgi:tetratricopeptide (TPR) repeat protein
MRSGRIAEGRDVLRDAYAPGGQDYRRLFDALLIATLATGEEDEAVGMALKAIQQGSTRLVPRAILALAGSGNVDLSEAAKFVGEDEFTFIELSLAFAELGRKADAVRLLQASGLEDQPLALYYLAYWSPSADAPAYLERASRLSHDYVFPSRPEAIPVLKFAIESRGGANAYLALGNLYAGLGRIDDAKLAWSEAARRDSSSSVAHRNLAMVSWKLDRDLDGAGARFEKAIAARSSDQTLFRDLGRVRLEQGRPSDAIALLLGIEARARRRPDVTLLLARAYVEADRNDDAIDLLAATTFSNREGDSGTWSLFSRAHIERGTERFEQGRHQDALRDFETALTYPRNLNVGRPAKPREARALFWKGKALDSLGRSSAARTVWTECASNLPLTDEQTRFIGECRASLGR